MRSCLKRAVIHLRICKKEYGNKQTRTFPCDTADSNRYDSLGPLPFRKQSTFELENFMPTLFLLCFSGGYIQHTTHVCLSRPKSHSWYNKKDIHITKEPRTWASLLEMGQTQKKKITDTRTDVTEMAFIFIRRPFHSQRRPPHFPMRDPTHNCVPHNGRHRLRHAYEYENAHMGWLLLSLLLLF